MASLTPVSSRTSGHPRQDLAGAIVMVAALAAMALIALLTLVANAQLSDPKFPALTGRIVDQAQLLRPEDRAAIEAELAELEAKSTDQVAVLTVNSLQGFEIEDYGYKLGRAWGIGQKDKNNGIVLIVAPKERKVRIEVGRGLEPVMTDTMSRIIIDNAILPAFRRGDFSGGVRAGIRDIKDTLLGDAEAVKDRAKGGRKAKGPDTAAILFLMLWLAIFAFIVYAHVRQSRIRPHTVGRRGRRYADDHIIIIPGGGGWGGGSGHWGGGSGGGGWSGGGGDFGGGGSSGSW